MRTNEPKIAKRIGHDSMRIAVTFSSGGKLTYRISRASDTLVVAFSNDRTELAKQTRIVQAFVKCRGDETFGQVIDRIELTAKQSKSGAEFVALCQVQ